MDVHLSATVNLVGGDDVRFTLTNAVGHIAGIVQPARRRQIRPLDDRRCRPLAERRGVARNGGAPPGHVVGRLGALGRRARRSDDPARRCSPGAAKAAPGQYVRNAVAPPFDASAVAAPVPVIQPTVKPAAARAGAKKRVGRATGKRRKTS